KADLEHDLLRRSHRHGVHDSAAFGHQALGHLNGALGGDRIAGDATQHDLAVAAANADAPAAGARTDLLLQIAGVPGDLHLNHADQLHALIEYRDVGGPNLLALNVQRAIRHRQRVYDIWRPHHSAGERLFDPQGTRLVNRDHDVPYGTTLFVLRLRPGMLQRPRCDPKQSRSDDHWHEKEMSQPYTNHPPPRYRSAISLLAAHHCRPVHFPSSWIAVPWTPHVSCCG